MLASIIIEETGSSPSLNKLPWVNEHLEYESFENFVATDEEIPLDLLEELTNY